MARNSRWTENSVKNGVLEFELSSWKYFQDFLRQVLPSTTTFIWRGQADSRWPLQSGFDRALMKTLLPSARSRISIEHLERFKLAARGRRGSNPPALTEQNDWWALGQHYGLITPLLDWSESPFVALFFAFEQKLDPAVRHRAIWALAYKGRNFNQVNKSLREKLFISLSTPLDDLDADPANEPLEIVRPMQDENPRLVSQAGLFTRVPLGWTVENWVGKHFLGTQDNAVLIKISIPSLGRIECLRALQHMNINYLSLFPDISGASRQCNRAITVGDKLI